MTTTIEQHVDIEAPAADAYSQWTQFTTMPRFMEHVHEVKQIDDTRLQWEVEMGGVKRTWNTEITEQIPDKRIAWKGTDGTKNAGCVTFHRLSDDTCRVMLQMDLDPEGVLEKTADVLHVIDRGVASELENFKTFLEARDAPTGRWTGAVPAPKAN